MTPPSISTIRPFELSLGEAKASCVCENQSPWLQMCCSHDMSIWHSPQSPLSSPLYGSTAQCWLKADKYLWCTEQEMWRECFSRIEKEEPQEIYSTITLDPSSTHGVLNQETRGQWQTSPKPLLQTLPKPSPLRSQRQVFVLSHAFTFHSLVRSSEVGRGKGKGE